MATQALVRGLALRPPPCHDSSAPTMAEKYKLTSLLENAEHIKKYEFSTDTRNRPLFAFNACTP